MFNPKILQDEVNVVAAAAEFPQVHFAIRDSGAIQELVRAAEQATTPGQPIQLRLAGQARERASCVWAELIKHTQSGKNIFQIV